MKKSLVLATVFLVCLLQLTVVNHFKIFSVKPDLILIGIVTAGLFSDLKFALALSFVAGAFKDIYAGFPFAINAVLMPLWTFLVINLARRVSIDINLTRALLVFVIAALNSLAMTIFFWYVGNYVSFGIFMRILFLGSLYTALVSLLVFKLLKVK